MLAALPALAGEDGPAPTGRELADLLWLRARLGGTEPHPLEPDVPSTTLPDRPVAPPDPSPEPHRPPAAPEAPATGRRPLHLPGPAPAAPPADGPRAAAPIRVGTARALPRRRELVRALRPLKRGVPSSDRTVLDEDATAERLARDPRWWPVLVPAVDRWLGVRLVVDAHGDSAALWEPLARELLAVLAESGIFRDVRLHHLTGLEPGSRPGPGSGTGPVLPDEDSAARPPGRTATLLLTDGVHPGWAGPRLRAALRRWALAGPTAVLHTLPEHLWSQTALAPEPGRFRTAHRADPRPRFTPYGLVPPPQPPGTLAVPVLGLTPEWLAPWARATAGAHAYDAPAVLLAPGQSAGSAPPPAQFPPPTGDFDSFLAQAQPRVFRLAALLAAVDQLSLGVMRLVQSALLPDSPPADLAEIVFSGILRIGESAPGAEPLGRAYEFAPGVRQRLRATLRRDEAEQVVATLSAHLATRSTALADRFTALVPDPAGPLPLPGAAAWAHAAAPGPATGPGRRFFLALTGVAVPGPDEPDAAALAVGAELVAEAFERLGYRPTGIDSRRGTVEAVHGWAEDARLGSDDLVAVYLAGQVMAGFGQQVELLLRESLLIVDRLTLEEFGRTFGRLGRLLLIVDQQPLRTPPSLPVHTRPSLTLLTRGDVPGLDFPLLLADRVQQVAAGADPSRLLEFTRLAPPATASALRPFLVPEGRPGTHPGPEGPYLLDQLAAWVNAEQPDPAHRELRAVRAGQLDLFLGVLRLLSRRVRQSVLNVAAVGLDGVRPVIDDLTTRPTRRERTLLVLLFDPMAPPDRARLSALLRTLHALTGPPVFLLLVNSFTVPPAEQLRLELAEQLVLLDLARIQDLADISPGHATREYHRLLAATPVSGSPAWQAALIRLYERAATPYPARLDRVQAALTTVPGAADAVLDLSDLIRADPFELVEQVYAVLLALADREPAPGLHAVVDRGELDMLDRKDRVTVHDWIDNGLVEVSGGPARALEVALLLGLPVVSTEPTRVPNSGLTYLVVTPADDRSVQLLALRNPLHGKYDAAHYTGLALHIWRCPVPTCTRYLPRFDAPPPLPSLDGGSAVCAEHRGPLLASGPRPAVAHFKAVADDDRFRTGQYAVEEGTSVTLDNLSATAYSVPLTVSFRDGAVTVQAGDIGASYRPPGSESTRWQDLIPDAPLRCPPGTRITVAPNTVLVRTGAPAPGELPSP
nr:SAV_2336 N-terminal domain-related protein [Kitasatospora sp. SID7827]